MVGVFIYFVLKSAGLTVSVQRCEQWGYKNTPEIIMRGRGLLVRLVKCYLFLLYSAVLMQRIAPRKVQITMIVAGISEA